MRSVSLREHSLAVVLSAIVLLNIIAIVILGQRVERQEEEWDRLQVGTNLTEPAQASDAPSSPPQKQVIRTQPLVRTLILEDTERCPRCWDIRTYIEALNDTINMAVETAPHDLFALPRLPALVFNASLEGYPTLMVDWEKTGYTVTIPDGAYAGTWYVLPTYNAPYYSLIDNTTRGLVNVTYLTMESCVECYDSEIMGRFLDSSRVTYTTRTVDVESPAGRRLVVMYNITALPTMLMDAQAGEYAALRSSWDIVGTIEKDGTYVLRDLQRFDVTYYDIVYAKLMNP